MKRIFIYIVFSIAVLYANAQVRDSVRLPNKDMIIDTGTRILNLYPFFSLHVDSSLYYKLLINKDPKNYYWYLKNAPVGLRVDKEGMLSFKSNKALFTSGRLKYDTDYTVKMGVQSLLNPEDKVDTSFVITFYNTDVIVPRVKPTIVSPVTIEEGNKLSFKILCEDGNFPIDKILFTSNIAIGNFKNAQRCDDTFEWTPPYDFVNEKDSARTKILNLFFIGQTKFNFSDTARIKVIVKDGLNYDEAYKEYNRVDSSMKGWVKRLKFTFLQLDKKVRKNKSYRSAFDITSATTTVSGTVISAMDKNNNAAGKVLPSIGVVLLPIKEASAPNKNVEQNQATLLRSTIKRLEYIMNDNTLMGDRDQAVAAKTETLKKELRQSQIQLSEVPTEISENMTDQDLDDYFNSPRVQKKYRLKQ